MFVYFYFSSSKCKFSIAFLHFIKISSLEFAGKYDELGFACVKNAEKLSIGCGVIGLSRVDK